MVCCAYYNLSGVWAQNNNHLVVRLPIAAIADFVSLVEAELPVTVSAPLIDVLLPGWDGRPTEIVPVLHVLREKRPLYGFSGRQSLTSLKLHWRAALAKGYRSRGYFFYRTVMDVIYLAVVHEDLNVVAIYTLSTFGFARFATWADTAIGQDWLMRQSEYNSRYDEFSSWLAIDRFGWVGF